MEYSAVFSENKNICNHAVEIEYKQKIYYVYIDGELYNKRELNQCLKRKGFVINSEEHSILYAYLTWNEEMHSHLLGAYSFYIASNDFAYICKDPLGLKPLYYMKKKKTLYISNRIEKILEDSCETACVDQSGLLELFSFGPGVSYDHTYYRGIEQLEMGTSLLYKEGVLKKHEYYKPIAKEHKECLGDTIAHVQFLVQDAIIRQMENCDASFLSGGLDSSIITGVCAQKRDDWNTYALQYEGNNENFSANEFQVSLDDNFIQDMTNRYELQHENLLISQNELCDLLDDALYAREFPGMADIDSSLLWLCKKVNNKHATILSGECADEIFGGYPWFYKEHFKEMDSFPWLHDSNAKQALLNETIANLGYSDYIKEKYNQTVKDISYLSFDSEENKYARKQTVLCLKWFMQTLVTRQVSQGNNAGVNIRSPFADVRILEYVYNIPWEMKYLNGKEKGILRSAFEQLLPVSIRNRKKNPFPKTHNPKYTQLIQTKLKEAYKDRDSILHILFDEEKLLDLIDSKGASYKLPWYGQLMSGPQLLAYLYQIHVWQKHMNIEICL